MSTVNYSVPEDVKEAFNRTFEGRNKSAVIADLMREAVERTERKARARRAFEQLNADRCQRPTITDDEIRAVRDELRE
jgi:hypothetical protein